MQYSPINEVLPKSHNVELILPLTKQDLNEHHWIKVHF